jgi:hypothetical protein
MNNMFKKIKLCRLFEISAEKKYKKWGVADSPKDAEYGATFAIKGGDAFDIFKMSDGTYKLYVPEKLLLRKDVRE